LIRPAGTRPQKIFVVGDIRDEHDVRRAARRGGSSPSSCTELKMSLAARAFE
jgi:hypothetical protein